MSSQYRTSDAAPQEAQNACMHITSHLETFLHPLSSTLDAYLDKRLVKTCSRCIGALLPFRNRSHGLQVAELGSYIEEGVSAPAGTKRIQRLLDSEKWTTKILEDFLWERSVAQKESFMQAGERPLCIWDGSVLEKPESENTPGLCRVKSSKAKRLQKRRKGIFNTPGGKPIVVKGLEWIEVILVGKSKPPCLIATRWWSRTGDDATTQKRQEKDLL